MYYRFPEDEHESIYDSEEVKAWRRERNELFDSLER